MTNILILGAGFGGIRTALDLEKKFRKNNDVKITVVDRRNFHLFTPSLYEVATVYGIKEDSFAQYLRGSVAIPFGEIFKNKKINFIQAEIQEINLKEKFVQISGGHKLNFDELIFALGGVTEFFGIPGVWDYAFDFKNIDDAVGIYKKIQEIYDKYQKEGRAEPIKITIIGGGFTGVELAAELSCCVGNIIEACKLDKQCTQISLFEAGEKILPAINDKQRKDIEKRLKRMGVRIMTNSAVIEAGPDYIKIHPVKSSEQFDGVKDKEGAHKTDLIIWAGGIRGPKFLENLGLKLNKKGFIEVNEFLQTIKTDGTKNQNIFVVGDSGGYIDPKTERPVPATAYIAHRQGAFVAENITRKLKNAKLKAYKPFYDIWVAPVGGKWAYFHYDGVNIKGFWGYVMRQFVDLRYFLTILPFNRAFSLFFKDLVLFMKND